MHFVKGHLYHVYNQGNNRETIFYSRENYLVFLRKTHLHIAPRCHILAWCLMPNHFHFLIGANDISTHVIKVGGNYMQTLANGFRLLQVNYAQYFNSQQHRSGSLFRQKAKAKCLTEELLCTVDGTGVPEPFNAYPWVCFHYIHQNPCKAGLAQTPLDWEFSSCRDFSGQRNGHLCDVELAQTWLGLTAFDLEPKNAIHLEEARINKIFV